MDYISVNNLQEHTEDTWTYRMRTRSSSNRAESRYRDLIAQSGQKTSVHLSHAVTYSGSR